MSSRPSLSSSKTTQPRTFTRYWLMIFRQVPVLFWRSANRVRTIVAVLIMLAAASNQRWGKLITARWEGIPGRYVWITIGLVLLWGVMKAIYERDANLVEQLAASEAAASASHSPQVILDFEPFFDDRPTRRRRALIVRNTGPATAVNVILEPFVVGENTVICDPVNRLLPSDTAKLTAEIRCAGEIRKPCLVELEGLFDVALGHKTTLGSPIALTIAYADLASRRYKIEYSVQYRRGINECLLEFKKLTLLGE
jgi:hypothetical protein